MGEPIRALKFDKMHLGAFASSVSTAPAPTAPAPLVAGNFQEQCDICGAIVSSMNESMLMKKY
jgi:hypothetical protein